MDGHLGSCPGLLVGCILSSTLGRGSMPVTDFLHAGLFLTVGGDDAVAAEIVVCLPLAEVAAVAQHLLTVYVGIE